MSEGNSGEKTHHETFQGARRKNANLLQFFGNVNGGRMTYGGHLFELSRDATLRSERVLESF